MTPRTAQMTLTPTGIRIGIATVPSQHIAPTQDAVHLQRALLAKPITPRNPDVYVGWMLAACGLAVAVMDVFGWLPGGGA